MTSMGQDSIFIVSNLNKITFQYIWGYGVLIRLTVCDCIPVRMRCCIIGSWVCWDNATVLQMQQAGISLYTYSL